MEEQSERASDHEKSRPRLVARQPRGNSTPGRARRLVACEERRLKSVVVGAASASAWSLSGWKRRGQRCRRDSQRRRGQPRRCLVPPCDSRPPTCPPRPPPERGVHAVHGTAGVVAGRSTRSGGGGGHVSGVLSDLADQLRRVSCDASGSSRGAAPAAARSRGSDRHLCHVAGTFSRAPLVRTGKAVAISPHTWEGIHAEAFVRHAR